jgi:AraC-like DNA-binding protein
MKNQTTGTYVSHRNAGQRTAELFLALLERQFPVHIPRETLALKTANDYAERLSVHVNHLNRTLKSSTGKTTSELITNRILQEGVQLLQHSTYSIGEIAYALGFEEQASFSNFIKKHTGLAPTAHRIV